MAGAPAHLVALFDSFSAAVVGVPFEELPWRDKAIDCRRSLLGGEAFPGASAKNMMRVDLLDGRSLEGKSAGYCPGVEIWTTEGIRRIDLLDLPEELRRCFEAEMEGKYVVILREFAARVEQASAISEKARREAAEFIEAAELSIKGLWNQVSELEAGLHEALAENAAVQDENAQLRAELEELGRSRSS
jgi:hypothetical protein